MDTNEGILEYCLVFKLMRIQKFKLQKSVDSKQKAKKTIRK